VKGEIRQVTIKQTNANVYLRVHKFDRTLLFI